MSGAKAIVAGRWVSSTSRPAGPGRSRTTVAAGSAASTTGVARTPERAASCSTSACCGRDRQPAGEVAADVRRRAAVDGDAVVEQRDGGRRRRPHGGATAQDLVRAPGRPDRREQRPGRRVVERRRRRPPRSTSAAAKVAAHEPLGEAGRIADEVRLRPCRSPVPRRRDSAPPRSSAASRSSTVRRHRAAGRDGVVLGVLGPGDQPLVVVGRVEEAAGRIARTARGSRSASPRAIANQRSSKVVSYRASSPSARWA